MEPPRRTRRREEAKLQKALIEAFKFLYPEGIVFHVPNGGYRNLIEAAHLKAMGVLAGIPDLWVIRPYQQVGIIEVKFEDGPYTKSQEDLFPLIEARMHTIHTVRCLDDLQPITRAWRLEDAAMAKALADAA